jgi:hypothetical protein
MYSERESIMWICRDCGMKYGTPRGGVSTFHVGRCEWCGEEKAVTEDRDYNYPQEKECTQ